MHTLPQKTPIVKPITKRTALSLVLSGYRIVYKGKLIQGHITQINGQPVVRKGA